jgi:hypothetical protein
MFFGILNAVEMASSDIFKEDTVHILKVNWIWFKEMINWKEGMWW